MAKEDPLWHLVEAKRADDSPTIFRIRELEPRLDQPRIFVAELPYPVADGSRLPDAPSYRRFATFEEQWLDPACNALGWTPVAVKIEDGSFFVYLYGADEPHALIERLSPFDGALGFFDEVDPKWEEYGALRELLEEAKTIPPREDAADEAPFPQDVDDDELIAAIEHTKTNTPVRRTKSMKSVAATKSKAATKAKASAKANAKPKAKAKTKTKTKTKAPAKPNAKAMAKAKPKVPARPNAKAMAMAKPKAPAKKQSSKQKPASKPRRKPSKR